MNKTTSLIPRKGMNRQTDKHKLQQKRYRQRVIRKNRKNRQTENGYLKTQAKLRPRIMHKQAKDRES